MLVLTVLNFALPNQHLFVWTAIGISSVSAILVGTARNAPRPKNPPQNPRNPPKNPHPRRKIIPAAHHRPKK